MALTEAELRAYEEQIKSARQEGNYSDVRPAPNPGDSGSARWLQQQLQREGIQSQVIFIKGVGWGVGVGQTGPKVQPVWSESAQEKAMSESVNPEAEQLVPPLQDVTAERYYPDTGGDPGDLRTQPRQVMTRNSPQYGSPLYNVVSEEFQTMPPSEREGQENVVRMLPQGAYQVGMISYTEKQKAIKEGMIYDVSESEINVGQKQKGKMMFEAMKQGKTSFEIPPTKSFYGLHIEDTRKKYQAWQDRELAITKIMNDPIVKASYVINKDWFGMGTVSELAVSYITGSAWEPKRQELLHSYASELYESKLTPEEAGILSAGIAGVKASLFALPGGAGGRTLAKMTAGTGKALYYGTTGYQTYQTAINPSSKNIARLFVYSVPLQVKAFTKLPKVKYGSVKIPIGPDKYETVYRGLHLEYGSGARTKPLVGMSRGRLKFGTPRIDLARADFSRGFTPETTLQAKVFKESAKGFYPEAEAMKMEYVLDIGQLTEKTKTKYLRGFPEKTKTLSPKGTQRVLSFARREKALLYGGYTAEPQMPKGKMGRTPGDIDVFLNVPDELAQLKARSLLKSLRSSGEIVRISKKSPLLIESKVGGKWHHAVDIHSIDTTTMDAMSPGIEKAWGFKYGQKPINIQDIKVMRLSEFGLRKGSSSITMRKMGVSPEAHRTKDIGDFITSQEVLLESKASGIRGLLHRRSSAGGIAKLNLYKDLVNVKPSEIVKMPLYSPGSMRMSSYSLIMPPSVFRSSPSPSPSMTVSRSLSPLVSPSISPKTSRSPSVSRILSLSKSASPSPSMTVSRSLSPLVSPSISPKTSRSPSIPVSRSPSRSPSLIPRISRSPPLKRKTPPSPILFPLPSRRKTTRKSITKKTRLFSKKTAYRPSLGGIVSGIRISKAPKMTSGLDIRYMIGGKKRRRRIK